MDYNKKTLQTYEDNVQQYVDKTPHQASAHVTDWIDRMLKHVSKTATILEIGSAFGRDADYIESMGFSVNRTDAAKSFVDLMRTGGKKAEVLDVLKDEMHGPYDLVFANAVFLHFKRAELKHVLSKIYKSLQSSGTLAFAVKKGTGSSWSKDKMDGPRFFCYWQAGDLKKLVTEAGFKDIKITEGKSRNATWLQIIAVKPD